MDRDEDYIDYGEDSDPCQAESSSEEDFDIIFHGTPDRKRKVHLRCSRHSSDQSSAHDTSSEDDFEKEMNQELNDTVASLESNRRSPKAIPVKNSPKAQCSKESESKRGDGESSSGGLVERSRYQDDVYVDSDEEEMVIAGDERIKRKHTADEDLFYDPNMDDDDQKWVDDHRKQHQPKQKGSKSQAMPHSDAVLDCPACMSTLCLDCQRHDKYENQYRAMFVMNCDVDKTEQLKYPVPQTKTAKKKSKKFKKGAKENNSTTDQTTSASPMCLTSDSVDNEPLFHPVRCTECNTVVAVYDEDEIYHFFNVLASYG